MLKLFGQLRHRRRRTELSNHHNPSHSAAGDVSRHVDTQSASSSNNAHFNDDHHQLRLASSSRSRKRKLNGDDVADVSIGLRGVGCADEEGDDVSISHRGVSYADVEGDDVGRGHKEVDEELDDVIRGHEERDYGDEEADDVSRGHHIEADYAEGLMDEEGCDVSREADFAGCLTDDVSRVEDGDKVDNNEGGKGLEVGKNRMEAPPDDDCCPICFGAFSVPCRGPCGHWYCGGCILQYWNYTAALQPCNCPMCSQKITKLTPEASISQQQDAAVTEVLGNVQKYNRLFVGGLYGMILKMFQLPLYIKRMFAEMTDRPGAHLNKLRIIAMTLGFVYSMSPFDFLRLGRHNVIDLFDYSAISLSLILYGVGMYRRRRRLRNVRELAAIQL